MGMSRRHVPATFRNPVKPGAVRGLLAALDALHAPPCERDPASDIAECEQRRRECEDRSRRQGELRFG